MTDATIISVSNVSKRFVLHKHKSVKERIVNFSRGRQFREDFWALRDVDLEISLGSTVGLVGHNGSGKSTLLKVIGGIIDPSTGTVARRGRMAALLELGAGFHPDLTGRDNVYLNAAILGLTQKEIDRYFDAIVDFSGIEQFIDTQVKFYSSGMYVRLAFAVAVHVDPDLLLVDEVLAVGDEPFQKKCMDKIAEFQSEGRTILLVSHSAAQVGALCDRVVVLDQGRVVHDGDPAEGIRVLRDGYEHERVVAVEAATESVKAHRDAEQFVSINSVDCVAAENGAGTDLTITCQVEVKQAVDSWGLGFSVENTLGTTLYAVDTFGEKIVFPNFPGTYSVEFSAPDLRLGSGKYLVNVGAGSRDGRTFSSRAEAGSFDSPGGLAGEGLVRVAPNFSVARAS